MLIQSGFFKILICLKLDFKASKTIIFPFKSELTFNIVLLTSLANEVSKTILNVNSDLNGKMIVFDALKSSLRQIKILKNPDCINKC